MNPEVLAVTRRIVDRSRTTRRAYLDLIARVYPNGSADVNAFGATGGMPYVVRERLGNGHLRGDILTISGRGLAAFAEKPAMDGGTLASRHPGPSGDDAILRLASAPFSPDGGLRILQGNITGACIKVSAVERERSIVEAPARVFDELRAFQAGELEQDVVVVVRFQGPRADGTPELHKLTPPLGVLRNRGFRIALVTDGRRSGAPGKVPCAIHGSPEELPGGAIGLIRDGDLVRVDADAGMPDVPVDAAEWTARAPVPAPPAANAMGREMFGLLRGAADEAGKGASAVLAGAGF